MTYTIRYQVFLSSTFTDLKEERAEVIQALWELDCIPTGMEAFLASNLSQWEIIQRVIDQCDYYVLIIGGRYGSLTEDGISYTENEYNYAKKISLPVLAFVHGEPEKIALGKSDTDRDLREKLESFRNRIMNDHPVRTWTTAHQLGSLVSRSLVQEIKRNPRPGWIRNDGSSPVSLLERIDKLTQENAALREKSTSSTGPVIPLEELAQGGDKVTISGNVILYNRATYQTRAVQWDVEVSWDNVFRHIGPSLISESSEAELSTLIGSYHQLASGFPYSDVTQNVYPFNWSLAAILIQLRALGLIDKGTKKRGINDKESYWRITDYGDRYLVGLLARRRAKNDTSNQ